MSETDSTDGQSRRKPGRAMRYEEQRFADG